MSTSVDIPTTILRLRKTFESKKTRPVEWRKQQINQVKKLLTENVSAFQESLQKDLGHKSQFFTSEIEIGTILGDIKKILENLDKWVKDEPRETPMAFLGSSSFVHFDPLGVVLIISPWNYPVSLVAQPLIGALAAGNCVLIKPSELAAHTSKVFATLIPKYLDKDAVAVVEGAVEETTLLLKQKWDHIIYTGNGTVGRIVMKAAAEHLTPVTLELGGKSPCIIDKSINVTVAATRIMWGKFLNCGQTCVAPDYVLVHKSREQEVLEAFKKALKEFYGEDPQKSPDYSRIINQRHCNRLATLIEKAKSENVEIVVGGKVDPSDNYIAPTIIRNVQPKSVLMEDEIFGPILPVLTVDSVEEAVDFINARDKPLALYIFSSNSSVQRFVIENTSSGGCVVNDCVAHVGNVNIPFGGVGTSGMGAYHGHTSFKTFSHNKAVLHRSFFGLDNPIRSPPYTSSKMQQFKLARKLEVSTSTLFLILGTLGVVLVGVGLAATGNGATVSNQAKRITIEALTAVIKFLQ